MIFKSDEEKNKVFKQIRISIGEPVRDYTKMVTDDVIETCIEMALEDYISYVDNWLVEQKWGDLEGLHIESSNFVEGFTTKTLDFEKSFAVAYGKQLGMSVLAPWELKKDYVTISANTQVYSIPSGREVNEVLWFTPAQVAVNGIEGFGINSAFGTNTMGFYGDSSAQMMLPAFTLMLSTMDRLQKKKIIQSELTYRIVGGPNGTKQLFLYPIPGSREEITARFGKTYDGAKVWYYYYDTNELGRDKCLEENEDIIKLPTDVPIRAKKFDNLNNPSKNKVRRLATSYVKNFLATIWAKTSGKVPMPKKGEFMEVDYQFFASEAEKEKEEILSELKDQLDQMDYEKIMEKKGSIAKNLNDVLSYTPSKLGIFWF